MSSRIWAEPRQHNRDCKQSDLELCVFSSYYFFYLFQFKALPFCSLYIEEPVSKKAHHYRVKAI